jgi:Uma2 family endonuclease
MGLAALKVEDLPHYTYDDYVQWEGRWELIRGIPYAMVPAPAGRHQLLNTEILFQLGLLLADCGRCRPLMPMDWEIAPDTVVQPDVLVVCADREDIEGAKLTIPPVLVFEILSPSTARKDRIIKYQLYQDAGVKYYCIVDPETKSADVFLLRDSEYHGMGAFREGKITFDLEACTIDFDFDAIFKE